MKFVPCALAAFLLLIYSAYAQESVGTSLYALPLLGIFVTSMIVVIVWLLYKDKLEGAVKKR